jgi:ankyrin repeat protein
MSKTVKDLCSWEVLQEAIQNGKVKLVNECLNDEKNRNWGSNSPLLEVEEYWSDNGKNDKKVEKKAIEMFNAILAKGANINQQFDLGETLLYKAIENDNPALVKLLLKNGADPNIPDMYGATPLHMAVLLSYPKIYKGLLLAGADPTIEDSIGSVAEEYIKPEDKLSFDKIKKEVNTVKGVAVLKSIKPTADMYKQNDVYTLLDAETIKKLHSYGGRKAIKTTKRRETTKRRKTIKR